MIGPSGAAFYIACADRLLGEVATAEGGDQYPVAAAHLEKSIAAFERLGAHNELALAWASYGQLLDKLGDRARAHEYLTRAIQGFERLGTLIEPDRVRRMLAELG